MKVSKKSVWYNMNSYQEHKIYQGNDTGIIFSDLADRTEKLRLNNVQLCLQLSKFATPEYNGVRYNVSANPIAPCILFPSHNHDYFEFNYVVEGTVLEYINDERYILEAGDLLVMNPSVYHAYYAQPETKAMNLLIPADYLENVCAYFEHIGEPCPLKHISVTPSFTVFHSPHPHAFDSFILPLTDMETVFFGHRPLANSYSENLFTQLVAMLTLNEHIAAQTVSYIDVKEAGTPLQIISYMKLNFTTVTLPSLSKKFGYSQSQIERIIRKYTGFSYSDYIATIRINTATHLIINTDYPISEIAKRVGVSVEYFYRLYKKHTGFTPMQFKRSNRSAHLVSPESKQKRQ